MHRNQLAMIALAGALVFSTGALAKPQVTTNVADGVNFADYSSYAWIRSTPPGGVDPVRYQRILADLDGRLAAKGYKQGDPADLTMVLTLGKVQKLDLDDWNSWGYHDAYARTEGEVSVDVFDTKTKRALWHGKVSDVIKNPKSPDPSRVDAALTSLMEQFPAHP